MAVVRFYLRYQLGRARGEFVQGLAVLRTQGPDTYRVHYLVLMQPHSHKSKHLPIATS